MQPVAGPSGPPVAGPSGPPVAGPSADVNPAQFDPLAEIEDARARRQDREERLEMLEKKRNSARINVYLFLAITVILGIFSFFPQSFGDNESNPQNLMTKNQAEDWFAEGNSEPDKIWDGEKDDSTTTSQNIYILGWPEMGSISEVRVDVNVAMYRNDGLPTDLVIAIYDGNCDEGTNRAHTELPAKSWYYSEEQLSYDESIDVTLYTQPGQKCIIAFWYDDEGEVDYGADTDIRATMDIEVDIYWPRMFTIPAGIICFFLAGFAFIGAQKTGRAFKELKYPEGPPEKKVEEEVLEAAEAEQRGEQLGVPEVETPEDSDTAAVEGPSLAEAAASPEQDSPVIEETSTEVTPEVSPVAEEPTTEEPAQAENTAGEWTDEQLLGAGWTQEQIDAMRNG
ncbi:MAG: hypothetical protein VX473_04225 [Candidatus Thermoplasmatota archaeon]|nr:hypothetical protein [Candidatus Thermoplasmatota archaeon]